MKKQKKLTSEEIEALRSEVYKMMKDNARETKEMKRERKEMFKEIRQLQKETAQQMKETDKKIARTEKMIANSNERIEGISKSNGMFCEEYFINSFKENPTFLGERFDYVLDYHKPYPVAIQDEYDLVLHNGATVVIIEVKYKAGLDDVGKTFSKLHTFRMNFPMFKEYKIYLGLASFSFSKAMRARAAEEGIVLIQQRGKKIEIVSENVKAW